MLNKKELKLKTITYIIKRANIKVIKGLISDLFIFIN
jgi:hypothetical protein